MPAVDDVWSTHFRDPAAAIAGAQALLAPGATTDVRTRAWAELTVGYHQLFVSAPPADAREALVRALEHFNDLGDRRGALLARTGLARVLLVEQAPLQAREALLAIQADANSLLPPQDRFWVVNALGATYYYTDRIDEAIQYLYEALETLRTVELSPQLPAVMSNLAAALVIVGDYQPARKLAEDALGLLAHFDNPRFLLLARTNLAEALVGSGEPERALSVVDAMLEGLGASAGWIAQNHFCAVAAETYALGARLAEAERCVGMANAILDDHPGGFNEVHARWAAATLADAGDDHDAALAALDSALVAAGQLAHLPTLCKAHARVAEKNAKLGRFELAFAHQRQLLEVERRRLAHRASVRYHLLKIEHELTHARDEQDRAGRQRQENERLSREFERMNAALLEREREIEALRGRLRAAAESPAQPAALR